VIDWNFERSVVIYMYSELVDELGGILLDFLYRISVEWG
jgi:hypothetical protein